MFWTLTPAEFRAIEKDALQELKVAEERENRRAARVIAAIYNNHPCKRRGKVYTEEDFLPKARVNRSSKDLLAKVTFFHNALTSAFEHAEKK